MKWPIFNMAMNRGWFTNRLRQCGMLIYLFSNISFLKIDFHGNFFLLLFFFFLFFEGDSVSGLMVF